MEPAKGMSSARKIHKKMWFIVKPLMVLCAKKNKSIYLKTVLYIISNTGAKSLITLIEVLCTAVFG